MQKRKLVIVLSVILGLLIIAAVLFLIFRNKPDEFAMPETTETAEVTESATAIASLTATKTAVKSATQTATILATAATKPDIDSIKDALAAKFSEAITSASISKQSENAAYGSFSMAQEGGYFVAVRDGVGWKIIADGNGTIECAVLDANNVPASVVGQCYDTPSESSITR